MLAILNSPIISTSNQALQYFFSNYKEVLACRSQQFQKEIERAVMELRDELKASDFEKQSVAQMIGKVRLVINVWAKESLNPYCFCKNCSADICKFCKWISCPLASIQAQKSICAVSFDIFFEMYSQLKGSVFRFNTVGFCIFKNK